MPELPSGFDNARPLFADELGTSYIVDQAERGGEEVAVRVLTLTVPSRNARRQFRTTCLAVAALAGQPGVLTLRAADFTADHHPYLVTDVPAGTLAARLADGPLPTQAAAGLGIRLATTLAAAHVAGVLHLDVRPANVMRSAPTSAPLLANFGVARAVSVAGQAELPTECLLHAGRELFGWDTPGPPADVYGLASTLYTALAGQAPYAGEARLGRAALYQRVLRGGPPPIARPGVPLPVAALLAAMMDPNPANRPDLGEVGQALADYAADGSRLTADWTVPDALAPTPAPAAPAVTVAAAPDPITPPTQEIRLPTIGRPPTSTRQPTRGGGRRYVGLMLLVAAGVLALLAGFVWGIVTGSRPNPGPSVLATTSASPISRGRLALYRAIDVKTSVRRQGVLVTWSAPATMTAVNAFLVIPRAPGLQSQVVGRTVRSALFSGLPSGQRYCFVVATLIESAAGHASTAATRPVCTWISRPPKRTRRTHHPTKTTRRSKKTTRR